MSLRAGPAHVGRPPLSSHVRRSPWCLPLSHSTAVSMEGSSLSPRRRGPGDSAGRAALPRPPWGPGHPPAPRKSGAHLGVPTRGPGGCWSLQGGHEGGAHQAGAWLGRPGPADVPSTGEPRGPQSTAHFVFSGLAVSHRRAAPESLSHLHPPQVSKHLRKETQPRFPPNPR